MKRIWIITLFPEYFTPLVECGVVGKALRGERGGEFELNVIQLSEFSPKQFKGVDDTPYGGGHGMVMRADVLKNALDAIVDQGSYSSIKKDLHVVFTAPRGKLWSSSLAQEFSEKLTDKFNKDIVFICGRYEGVDERFIEVYVDEILCVGDYILSGGEPAVLVIIDSAMRFCEEVLGNKMSATEESFSEDLLEHPYYTRPQVFEGKEIPEVLRQGHHKKIEQWKQSRREELTKRHRPDLWQRYNNNE